MFKKDGKKINLPTGDYGIGEDGTLYLNGLCPEGVEGFNYPVGLGPLFTEEGRAELGITEEADAVRPDDRFFWVSENEDGSFTATPKDRDASNLLVWEKIRAKRDDRRNNGGVKVSGKWFLTNQQAVSEYTAMAMIGAGLPDSTVLRAEWRTMDGSRIDMTAGLVKKILAAGFAALAANDDAANSHKAALETCQDPSTYDFASGWPLIFSEDKKGA